MLNRCLSLRGLMTASLLLPLWAAAESQLQAGPPNRKVSATAHVDFKIVIPPVLSLGVAGGCAQEAGAQQVQVFSNSRNVALAASSSSIPAASNNVILRAAAGKVIAREAACQLSLGISRRAASAANGMICTVSMP